MFSSEEEMKAELLRLQREDPSAIEKLEQQLDEYRVSLCREDPNYFVQYVLRDEETQEPIKQAPYHVRLQEACTRSKAASILGHTELGKALPIDTEIPTPSGWKLLKDLHPGDFVFAMDGSPTRIISETPVTKQSAYRIVFSDGTYQLASGDHQWLAWTGDRFSKNLPAKVVTTKQMLDTGLYVGKSSITRWRIPVCDPVRYSEASLPLHPYAFGVWLGDGDSRQFTITCHTEDIEMISKCESATGGDWVYRFDTAKPHILRVRRRGTNHILKELGVKGNKHIPDIYKFSSVEQRIELIRGIMDTDGHIVASDGKNTIELSLTNKQLALDVLEVIRSLGEKVTFREASITNYDHNRYRIHWTASDLNPFYLHRKAQVVIPREKSKRLTVKAITAIIAEPDVDMKCIGVEHETHTYIAGRSYTVTHNCVTSLTIFLKRDGKAVTTLDLKKDLDEGKKVEVLTLNQVTRQHEWVEVESVEYDSHAPCSYIETEDGDFGIYSDNHPFYVKLAKQPDVEGWITLGKLDKKIHHVAVTERTPVLESYSEEYTDLYEAFLEGLLIGLLSKGYKIPKALELAECTTRFYTPVSAISYSHDVIRLVTDYAGRKGWKIMFWSKENEFTLSKTQHIVLEGITPWLTQRGYRIAKEMTSRGPTQRLVSDNPLYFYPEIFKARPEIVESFLAGLLVTQEGKNDTRSPRGKNFVVLMGFPFAMARGVRWLVRNAGYFMKLGQISDAKLYDLWTWNISKKTYKPTKTILSSFDIKKFVTKMLFVFMPIVHISRLLKVSSKYMNCNDSLARALKQYSWMAGEIPSTEVGLDDPNKITPSDEIDYVLKEWAWKKVRTVIPAGVQATYAVTVKSAEHTHLTDGILTHNTQQISIGRSLWEIGKNPNIRICVIQATEGLAEDIVSTIKRYIEHSPEYKRIFPHVRRGVEWTTTSLSVERSPTIKDPTVLAAGVHGNILGRRFDLIIGDDFLTSENTATEYMRDDVFNWMLTTPMSRITRNGRIWLIGNAWSREDALHRFSRMQGWDHYIFPVRDPVTKKSYWPERWPEDRIADFEMRRTPWEVARALDCKARSDEAGRFREVWFNAALERGHGLFGDDTMCWALDKLPPGCQTFTGVDLGISEAAGADVTAITTLMVKPDNRIVLLNVEAGNWDANEIIERIIRKHHMFKSLVFVESLFAQRWILQLIRKRAPNLPVFPFQTRGTGTVRNKRHTFFGVESLAAELAQGLWDIPRSKNGVVDPEIQAFVQGCLAYAPDEHTDDRVMSAWIALQGARKQTGIIGTGMTAESGMQVMLETTPLSYEERMEMSRQERSMEKQKSAESWWEDVRNELDLPEYEILPPGSGGE